MNTDRLDTLTEHNFRLEGRVRDLETNMMRLGVATVLVTLIVSVLVNRKGTNGITQS